MEPQPPPAPDQMRDYVLRRAGLFDRPLGQSILCLVRGSGDEEGGDGPGAGAVLEKSGRLWIDLNQVPDDVVEKMWKMVRSYEERLKKDIP